MPASPIRSSCPLPPALPPAEAVVLAGPLSPPSSLPVERSRAVRQVLVTRAEARAEAAVEVRQHPDRLRLRRPSLTASAAARDMAVWGAPRVWGGSEVDNYQLRRH